MSNVDDYLLEMFYANMHLPHILHIATFYTFQQSAQTAYFSA